MNFPSNPRLASQRVAICKGQGQDPGDQHDHFNADFMGFYGD